MRKAILMLCISLFMITQAQELKPKTDLPQGHPRYLTHPDGKEETIKLIHQEAWAKEVFSKLKSRTDRYADLSPEWLTSRLQMYWKSCATDVYIKGEFYDHSGGKKAPAPTVMFTGSRGHGTVFSRPSLDEIEPYYEDTRGMYLVNNTSPTKTKEWVHINKTGRIIESINNEIMGYARDAAFLWWITGEKKYADLATSVFDTYTTGLYYRNVPIDLNNGHQQTLVGMTSFEVIHEDIFETLVQLYDFLYNHLLIAKPEKMSIYANAFQKCADNIIDKGVPHNNWNLFQARFIINFGLVLDDNTHYPNGKGREYYIDYVLNQSSIRQWSLSRLANYGYCQQTGIWAECPGYSTVVATDFANFIDLFDRNLKIDLTQHLPVLTKAIEVLPQYLLPNRMMVGFGDTHPGQFRTSYISRMIQNAQNFNKRDQEATFTAMLKLFDPQIGMQNTDKKNIQVAVSSFFTDKPLTIDPSLPAGNIDDYVTPSFYADNVSWIAQRNGMHPQHSLMLSVNASEGNHAHANGISMELYGKGFTLAPDAGIGYTLYQGLDYLEYYSQFPAHNTVCVDGISAYPIMKSNQPFKLLNAFPKPNIKVPYQTVAYNEVEFREPESNSQQRRLTSIITTSPTSGYYVDIFRSRKIEGGDKFHDYFYHNMGQSMHLTAADNSPLSLHSTDELAFAGAHLYAYSYIFNKRSCTTPKDIKTVFTINMSNQNNIHMNMWTKGSDQRTHFSALSPSIEGLSRAPGMPYNIKEQPCLTYVARQQGEAWLHPFVSIFEPSTDLERSTIKQVSYPTVQSEQEGSHVAIIVQHHSGRTDRILSSDLTTPTLHHEQLTSKASYCVWSTSSPTADLSLFMGNGTLVKTPNISIQSAQASTVLVENKNEKWLYTASNACTITIKGKKYKLSATTNNKEIQ